MTQIRKPTPERIEYEKAAKNLRVLDLKAKLSEVGINTSKVPRQKLDEILRGIEMQNNAYQESQLKIRIIQQATQETINKIAQEGEAIVESMKKEYPYGRYISAPVVSPGETETIPEIVERQHPVE